MGIHWGAEVSPSAIQKELYPVATDFLLLMDSQETIPVDGNALLLYFPALRKVSDNGSEWRLTKGSKSLPDLLPTQSDTHSALPSDVSNRSLSRRVDAFPPPPYVHNDFGRTPNSNQPFITATGRRRVLIFTRSCWLAMTVSISL